VSFLYTLSSLSILLGLSIVKVCFCDSSEIEESSSGEEQKQGLNESKPGPEETPKSNESSTPSIFSRIYNFPLIQNRIFTLKVSHIVSVCFSVGLYMGGVDAGVNMVFERSYVPLIKKLMESPHRVFIILDEQSTKDKFVSRAIDLACKMKDNETP
jgi:hypothetical protein